MRRLMTLLLLFLILAVGKSYGYNDLVYPFHHICKDYAKHEHVASVAVVDDTPSTPQQLGPDYYSQFIKTEIFLETNSGEILMYVEDIDATNNVIIGRTNSGVVYFPISEINYVRKQIENQKGVYVHD